MGIASLKTIKEEQVIAVRSPYDGQLVGTVPETPATAIGSLLERAKSGAQMGRSMPRNMRASILEKAAQIVADSHEDFSRLITLESGKTIRQARKEASRCVNTLKLSAEVARREAGEVIPFDAYAGSETRKGWFTREPLGIIAAITPYNDPLNLVAHKLGPAIAGGNAVILKPSELTPLSALRLLETLVATGLPPEVVTVAVGGAELGKAIVRQRDVRMVSFTGGFATGEAIASTAGLKKMSMDLGGNAPVIVMADCDLKGALEGILSGAFWAAGQNCIGTQRVLVQADIYQQFRDAFVRMAMTLKVGDPQSQETDVGPMINVSSVDRVERFVNEALASGANLLCGNTRKKTLYYPTLLEKVPHHCTVWREEIFAPVCILEEFGTLNQAIDFANEPEYMLHAGIFTRNLNDALQAAEQIEAGGVMINDSSDYRFDAMPFGGFKYGSMGREGVRFAYEDMTQPKVICINRQ